MMIYAKETNICELEDIYIDSDVESIRPGRCILHEKNPRQFISKFKRLMNLFHPS